MQEEQPPGHATNCQPWASSNTHQPLTTNNLLPLSWVPTSCNGDRSSSPSSGEAVPQEAPQKATPSSSLLSIEPKLPQDDCNAPGETPTDPEGPSSAAIARNPIPAQQPSKEGHDVESHPLAVGNQFTTKRKQEEGEEEPPKKRHFPCNSHEPSPTGPDLNGTMLLSSALISSTLLEYHDGGGKGKDTPLGLEAERPSSPLSKGVAGHAEADPMQCMGSCFGSSSEALQGVPLMVPPADAAADAVMDKEDVPSVPCEEAFQENFRPDEDEILMQDEGRTSPDIIFHQPEYVTPNDIHVASSPTSVSIAPSSPLPCFEEDDGAENGTAGPGSSITIDVTGAPSGFFQENAQCNLQSRPPQSWLPTSLDGARTKVEEEEEDSDDVVSMQQASGYSVQLPKKRLRSVSSDSSSSDKSTSSGEYTSPRGGTTVGTDHRYLRHFLANQSGPRQGKIQSKDAYDMLASQLQKASAEGFLSFTSSSPTSIQDHSPKQSDIPKRMNGELSRTLRHKRQPFTGGKLPSHSPDETQLGILSATPRGRLPCKFYKLGRLGLGGCTNPDCAYLHRLVRCNRGSKCRILNNCAFVHPGEEEKLEPKSHQEPASSSNATTDTQDDIPLNSRSVSAPTGVCPHGLRCVQPKCMLMHSLDALARWVQAYVGKVDQKLTSRLKFTLELTQKATENGDKLRLLRHHKFVSQLRQQFVSLGPLEVLSQSALARRYRECGAFWNEDPLLLLQGSFASKVESGGLAVVPIVGGMAPFYAALCTHLADLTDRTIIHITSNPLVAQHLAHQTCQSRKTPPFLYSCDSTNAVQCIPYGPWQLSECVRILFTTDLALLQALISDPETLQDACLVIDVTPCRSFYTDLLLALLKKRHLQAPVNFLACTMGLEGPLAEYMGCDQITTSFSIPCSVHYEPPDSKGMSLLHWAALQVKKILQGGWQKDSKREGDIVVFLADYDEVHSFPQVIAPLMTDLTNQPEICPLPGLLSTNGNGTSRVYLAIHHADALGLTNVAWVVDSGRSHNVIWDAERDIQHGRTVMITSSVANARASLGPFTRPCTCIRLYREADLVALDTLPPVVPTVNTLGMGILLLKAYKVSAEDLQWPVANELPPEGFAIAAADLQRLGATNEAGALTKVGQMMVHMPLEPRPSKVVLHGASLGCWREAAALGTVISCSQYLHTSEPKQEGSAGSFLWAYRFLCGGVGVTDGPVPSTPVCRLLLQLQSALLRLIPIGCIQKEAVDGHSEVPQEFSAVLRRAAFEAFIPNLSMYTGHPALGYYSPKAGGAIRLHSSVASNQAYPMWVVYFDAMCTGATGANAMVVDKEWLLDGKMKVPLRSFTGQQAANKALTRVRTAGKEFEIQALSKRLGFFVEVAGDGVKIWATKARLEEMVAEVQRALR